MLAATMEVYRRDRRGEKGKERAGIASGGEAKLVEVGGGVRRPNTAATAAS